MRRRAESRRAVHSHALKRERLDGPETSTTGPAPGHHSAHRLRERPGRLHDPAPAAPLRQAAVPDVRADHPPAHHLLLRRPVPGRAGDGPPLGPLRPHPGAHPEPDRHGDQLRHAGLRAQHRLALRRPHPGRHHRGQHHRSPGLHHGHHSGGEAHRIPGLHLRRFRPGFHLWPGPGWPPLRGPGGAVSLPASCRGRGDRGAHDLALPGRDPDAGEAGGRPGGAARTGPLPGRGPAQHAPADHSAPGFCRAVLSGDAPGHLCPLR